jgi:hypothetical protein
MYIWANRGIVLVYRVTQYEVDTESKKIRAIISWPGPSQAR